jgi:hypothetical protein
LTKTGNRQQGAGNRNRRQAKENREQGTRPGDRQEGVRNRGYGKAGDGPFVFDLSYFRGVDAGGCITKVEGGRSTDEPSEVVV